LTNVVDTKISEAKGAEDLSCGSSSNVLCSGIAIYKSQRKRQASRIILARLVPDSRRLSKPFPPSSSLLFLRRINSARQHQSNLGHLRS